MLSKQFIAFIRHICGAVRDGRLISLNFRMVGRGSGKCPPEVVFFDERGPVFEETYAEYSIVVKEKEKPHV